MEVSRQRNFRTALATGGTGPRKKEQLPNLTKSPKILFD